MPIMIITDHACQRYVERVRPCTVQEARIALGTDRIRAAVAFGARYVKLGGGQHIVLDGERVVTVLPRGHYVGTFDRRNDR